MGSPILNTWRRFGLLLKVAVMALLSIHSFVSKAATTVTQVSAGIGHSLFVKSDGSLWGMGYNSVGGLGLGSNVIQVLFPQQILSNGVTAVAAGQLHTIFLKSNGSLWAMGYNVDGELGDGTTNNRYTPVQILASNVVAIAAGDDHSLYTTVVVSGSSPNFTFRFTLEGNGDNSDGQLGTSSTSDVYSPAAIQLTADVHFSEVTPIAAGHQHSLFTKSDGSLWGMGRNDSGQLGIGSYNNADSPQQIVPSSTAIVVAAAGGTGHSLFIESDGSLWAMGDNSLGELGDGSTNGHNLPEKIMPGGVTAVSAGDGSSLFIESDGSLWGMGENIEGQLGLGIRNNQLSPVKIVSSNVVAISAGQSYSLFIKSDGSLWGMGDNQEGELGLGTNSFGFFPVRITPPPPVPVITGVTLSGTNLVVNATNGISTATYYVMSGTNLARPVKTWTPVATNTLNVDGAFSVNVPNAARSSTAQQFYTLMVQ